MTAQEKSLGKTPDGATRTRTIALLKAVMRTLALPARSSTPSGSFSTLVTLPMCCQPCAAAPPETTSKTQNHAIQTKCRTNLDVCSSESDRRLVGGQAARTGEPLFKKRRRFRAFHAAADGVHHAAVEDIPASVKSEPVRKIKLPRLALHFERSIAQFEKTLQKNHAKNLFAEQFRGARFV